MHLVRGRVLAGGLSLHHAGHGPPDAHVWPRRGAQGPQTVSFKSQGVQLSGLLRQQHLLGMRSLFHCLTGTEFYIMTFLKVACDMGRKVCAENDFFTLASSRK